MRPVRFRAVVLLLLALVLGGCGISVQRTPEPIPLRTPDVAVSPTPSAGPATGTVYFIRGTRLEGARRKTTTGDLGEMLALLSAGPSSAETHGGLRTAVTPQSLTAPGNDDSGTLTLRVTDQFTGVVSGDQLLAVAQVVWTVTEFPAVRRVRFVSDGQALEVPTDHGLTARPVDRSDYRTVAPVTTGPSPAAATSATRSFAPGSATTVPAPPT